MNPKPARKRAKTPDLQSTPVVSPKARSPVVLLAAGALVGGAVVYLVMRQPAEPAAPDSVASGATAAPAAASSGAVVAQQVKNPAHAGATPEQLDTACAKGDGEACALRGRATQANGDSPGAAKLFKQSCDAGWGAGCTALGLLHFGPEPLVPPDGTEAVTLFERACVLGDPDGCVGVGRVLLNRPGAAKDVQGALDAWTRACDANQGPSCRMLAIAYRGIEGVPADAAKAAAFLKKACDAGDQHACKMNDDG